MENSLSKANKTLNFKKTGGGEVVDVMGNMTRFRGALQVSLGYRPQGKHRKLSGVLCNLDQKVRWRKESNCCGGRGGG